MIDSIVRRRPWCWDLRWGRHVSSSPSDHLPCPQGAYQRCPRNRGRINASLQELAATIKARWVCAQAHQQMKEELGLDHVKGRSWTGLHRHALMTMIALCFLQHLRLQEGGKGKEPDPPGHHRSRACRPSADGWSSCSAARGSAARTVVLKSALPYRTECLGSASVMGRWASSPPSDHPVAGLMLPSVVGIRAATSCDQKGAGGPI